MCIIIIIIIKNNNNKLLSIIMEAWFLIKIMLAWKRTQHPIGLSWLSYQKV